MIGNPDLTSPAGQKPVALGSVENLLLFHKIEGFIDYFEPIVERFPSFERYAMRTYIKACMYRIYELIIRTNSSANKRQGWYDIDVELKILKGYLRRSRKRGSRYLSKKSYEHAGKMLAEIGRLNGGLINKEKAKSNSVPYARK